MCLKVFELRKPLCTRHCITMLGKVFVLLLSVKFPRNISRQTGRTEFCESPVELKLPSPFQKQNSNSLGLSVVIRPRPTTGRFITRAIHNYPEECALFAFLPSPYVNAAQNFHHASFS